MTYRTLIAMAAACVLLTAGSGSASAASGGARGRFSNLVSPERGARVRAQAVSNLSPAAVRNFDFTLTRYLRRFGLVPPTASTRLGRRILRFRQQFIVERFTPGATVGGVFFSTSATPSNPATGVSPFTFFPVFTTVL